VRVWPGKGKAGDGPTLLAIKLGGLHAWRPLCMNVRYVPAIGQGDLPAWWTVHTGHGVGRSLCLMACTYRSLCRKISLINGLFILAIDQGGLPTQWPVCTGHQPGRSPRPMAGMCQPSIREVSPPNSRYVPAFDQGGLPAQWSVCTGHQSERTPLPMTNMHRPSTRDVSLPNDQYLPAFDHGGLPAQRPVCIGYWSGSSSCPTASIYRPLIREVSLPNGRYVPAINQGGRRTALPGCGRTPACKGCNLVRAWALHIKEEGPKMQAVYLAWMAVQERLWPLWRFHAIIGQYGRCCGEKMANLVAQGHWMARLAVQNHIWPFWRASTTIKVCFARNPDFTEWRNWLDQKSILDFTKHKSNFKFQVSFFE
jgi:hypothetical protein